MTRDGVWPAGVAAAAAAAAVAAVVVGVVGAVGVVGVVGCVGGVGGVGGVMVLLMLSLLWLLLLMVCAAVGIGGAEAGFTFGGGVTFGFDGLDIRVAELLELRDGIHACIDLSGAVQLHRAFRLDVLGGRLLDRGIVGERGASHKSDTRGAGEKNFPDVRHGVIPP